MRRFALTALFLLTLSCASAPRGSNDELRGVWVATVANLDWPSRRGLPADEQRRELIAILDHAKSAGLNAVFLQVRPAADAIYPSSLEPWTEFLSGTMGRPPQPEYDPLAFAVAEAHARGLELHAWFNPFRARHSSQTSEVADAHVIKAHPERAHVYGTMTWLDPGDENVRRDAIAVVLDVVRRYDVDGVHMDDYFYPYPEKDLEFPDEATYARYRDAGGTLERGDWRRDNVNRFVRDLYRAVKAERAEVTVGISPFGIWRPGHPPQIAGLDAYDRIYADARLWLQEGWVDYLAPQLYWPIDKREQSFPVLLDWWVEQDTRRVGIVAGISVGRHSPEELARQLAIVKKTRGARGFILFRAKTLMEKGIRP